MILSLLVQLSGGKPVEATPSDPSLLSRLEESEGQVKQLRLNLDAVKREKEQVNSDISVLQDTMHQQREKSAREVRREGERGEVEGDCERGEEGG